MKIAKIDLRDFRGFPGPETFSFDLDSKNLLVYGENGSGKSSLYRALAEFFTLDRAARPFTDHRNIFSAHPSPPSSDGHVTLELSNGSRYSWKCGGDRARIDPATPQAMREYLTDVARRAAFLEYRSLLRTNFDISNLSTTLFELAVSALLAHVPIAIPGGTEVTLNGLWERFLASLPGPARRYSSRAKAEVLAAAKAFNDGFSGVLPDVVRHAEQFLSFFAGSGLKLAMSLPGVRFYDIGKSRDRKVVDRVFNLQVQLHGIVMPEWNSFLNEARLSALALSLYLAATLLHNPSAPSGSVPPLKLLVLDDVLIGLDHSNRLPVLDILENRFADTQVILLTHDRVWFDMARTGFQHPDKWRTAEMTTVRCNRDSLSFDKPVIRWPEPDVATDHLRRAKDFLDAPFPNLREAAVHARVAFEAKLKGYCKKHSVPVPYDPDGREINTDGFLQAIEQTLRRKGTMPRAAVTIQRVKMFRKTVLNPLAHAHPITLAGVEVRFAIEAVAGLKFHDASTGTANPRSIAETASVLLAKTSLSDAERLDAASAVRTAFEVDLRVALERLGGRIPFKLDPTELTLAEIWDAAKEAMNRKNAGAAGPLIADIEAKRSFFLDEWDYHRVSALTQFDLKADWGMLRDATATGLPKTRLATFQ